VRKTSLASENCVQAIFCEKKRRKIAKEAEQTKIYSGNETGDAQCEKCDKDRIRNEGSVMNS